MFGEDLLLDFLYLFFFPFISPPFFFPPILSTCFSGDIKCTQRHCHGFDHGERALRLRQHRRRADGYPPYNVEKTGMRTRIAQHQAPRRALLHHETNHPPRFQIEDSQLVCARPAGPTTRSASISIADRRTAVPTLSMLPKDYEVAGASQIDTPAFLHIGELLHRPSIDAA